MLSPSLPEMRNVMPFLAWIGRHIKVIVRVNRACIVHCVFDISFTLVCFFLNKLHKKFRLRFDLCQLLGGMCLFFIKFFFFVSLQEQFLVFFDIGEKI